MFMASSQQKQIALANTQESGLFSALDRCLPSADEYDQVSVRYGSTFDSVHRRCLKNNDVARVREITNTELVLHDGSWKTWWESVEPASKDPVPFVRSGAICTAAALNRFISHCPGIDDRCSRLFVYQDAVQARETVEEATPKC
jgi:hypothetical protein